MNIVDLLLKLDCRNTYDCTDKESENQKTLRNGGKKSVLHRESHSMEDGLRNSQSRFMEMTERSR